MPRRTWEQGIHPYGLGQPNPGPVEDIPLQLPDDGEQWQGDEPRAPRRLLDANDLNIGRQALIYANVPAALRDAGRGRETALVDLVGDSRFGQVVTVCFAAFDPSNFPDGATLAAKPGVPVGIIRFGNGAGMAELEIDIPNPNSHASGQSYANSGVAISVPAGNLRVLARDDSRIIPGSGPAQLPMITDLETGGQLVSAHVVYGDRGSPGKIYRSLQFANAMTASEEVILRVPAFARTVQFVRHPKVGTSLLAAFEMGRSIGPAIIMDYVELTGGVDSLIYPVPPRVTQIRIVHGGGVDMTSGWAVFEIAL